MRSALFWDITRRRVVMFTDVSGQGIGPIFLDFLTLEDGTDTLSRKIGKQLPHDAAKYPTRQQNSSTIKIVPNIIIPYFPYRPSKTLFKYITYFSALILRQIFFSDTT
jgi:hypothetical protein